ncbi:MAG: histidinol-phosphatase [Desulfobacteraceae bacterium]|nr:histidinol-phosphatase [Desulfobacteraceae bacterium]
MDYHVHTMLCSHARGTMEQYVNHAMHAGISEICFLDHLTLNKKGRDLSMTPDEVPLYYYAARRLQAAYRGGIKIKVGLEVDFTPELAESARTVAESFDFDVIGGSVHFIDRHNLVSSRTDRRQTEKPDAAFYESYLDLVNRMLDLKYIDIVCHLDVIKKFGTLPPDWFYDKARALLDKIAQTGKVLEINTSGAAHPVGEIYPRPGLLEECRKRNIPLSLGSDAHLPEQVGRGFAEAAKIIKNAGYSRITAFDRKNRYSVPIQTPKG